MSPLQTLVRCFHFDLFIIVDILSKTQNSSVQFLDTGDKHVRSHQRTEFESFKIEIMYTRFFQMLLMSCESSTRIALLTSSQFLGWKISNSVYRMFTLHHAFKCRAVDPAGKDNMKP